MFRFVLSSLLLVLFTGMSMAQQATQSAQYAALAVGVVPDSDPSALEEAPTAVAPAARVSFPRAASFHNTTSSTLPFDLSARTAPAFRSTRSVDLLSFEGSFIKDLVRLNWTVRPEASVLGFSVERRSQAEETWTTIRYIRASARENLQGYSFFDHNGVDGVTYYRLRQVEKDGKSTPSSAISVMPHVVPNSFVIWQHKVDPFTRFGALSFGLGSEMPVTITMIDSYGRVVATVMADRDLESGHHIIPFGTHALPSGVYTLRMETNAGMQSRRLAIF